MQFPQALFKQAGLTPSDVAALCEVSRVTGWRWMHGNRDDGAPVGVNIFLQAKVRRLSDKVQRAVDAGVLPDVTLVHMPPAQRAQKIKSILNQNRPMN